MKIINVEQRSDEWLALRKGKVTGTVAKRIMGTKLTNEECFYELLAERLSIDEEEDESAMDRGVRLEPDAIQKFREVTGKKVETIGFCVSDISEHIAYSPDGLIKVKGKYKENVEAKCLASKNHLRAYIEQKVPRDYWYQVIQGFVVNDDLDENHVVFYDPRVIEIPFFFITIKRGDVLEEIEESKEKQLDMLQKIDETISSLITF